MLTDLYNWLPCAVFCILLSRRNRTNSNTSTIQLKPGVNMKSAVLYSVPSRMWTTRIIHVRTVHNIHAFERQVIDITYLVQKYSSHWHSFNFIVISSTQILYVISYPFCAVFMNPPEKMKFCLHFNEIRVVQATDLFLLRMPISTLLIACWCIIHKKCNCYFQKNNSIFSPLL